MALESKLHVGESLEKTYICISESEDEGSESLESETNEKSSDSEQEAGESLEKTNDQVVTPPDIQTDCDQEVNAKRS